MKEAKKVQVTEQICKQIQLMRKGGANQTEVGRLLSLSGPTISRIEKAGFSLEKYLENKRMEREKEQQAKAQAEEPAEEQVPGQMEMDLKPKEPEMSEQVKMMRFIASQADKLALKLDHINDTLGQILRAMRRE